MSNNKRASRDERSMREKMRLRRAAGEIKALQQQIGAREKRGPGICSLVSLAERRRGLKAELRSRQLFPSARTMTAAQLKAQAAVRLLGIVFLGISMIGRSEM